MEELPGIESSGLGISSTVALGPDRTKFVGRQ